MAEAKTIEILGVEFSVTMPYDAGHTINEAEAKVLNQTRRENLGNNFRAKVKAFNDNDEGAASSIDELQSQFAELDAAYVFTLSTASAAVKRTPEEKEAINIAKNYIKAQLDAAGRKITDVPKGEDGNAVMSQEDWDDAVTQEIERIAATEEVKKMAKDIVKARDKTKGLALGSLNLGA